MVKRHHHRPRDSRLPEILFVTVLPPQMNTPVVGQSGDLLYAELSMAPWQDAIEAKSLATDAVLRRLAGGLVPVHTFS